MDTTHRRELPGGRLGRAAWPREANRRLRMGARWLSLTLLALALAVAVAVLTLHPPTGHVKQLAFYLALAGAGSLALGEAALWGAGALRIGGIRLQLALPALLTALVIGFTVVALAQAMFISPEDSTLLLVFLGFAVLVALTLAGSLANEMARAIGRVETGARRIAQGDYAFRVPESDAAGNAEELAQLARWFNAMAANVEEAFAQRERAEADRRAVLAALSHDLRTPLASVRAMIEAIDDGVAADEVTVRRYQKAIRAEVRRLSLLIDELFDLSRLEAGALVLQPERLGIEDLLSDALESFGGQAEQGALRLVGQVAEGLPPVAIDPRQIGRTLANLVSNALRYTPADGAIVLRAEPQVRPDGRAEVQVQVLDSGAGISAADLPHIFERTYRGDTSRARHDRWAEQLGCGSGAGLGLAIARGIVELHGGRIWAVSPLPDDLRAHVQPLVGAGTNAFAGTALCFTLPAAKTAYPSRR